MPRLPSTLVLVGLLLLAGCIGGPPAGTDTTTTPTVTPTSHADPTENPDTRRIGESQIVDFEDLNREQQAAFRDALDGEVSFVPNTSYVDESEGYRYDQSGPFREHGYVRYDGDLYRINLAQGAGKLYASYQIHASVGVPDDNTSVNDFENLPADIQDEVRTALTEGRYCAPLGKWNSLPEPLADTRYVRYENQTYRMGYAVGDAWADIMTVEKVE